MGARPAREAGLVSVERTRNTNHHRIVVCVSGASTLTRRLATQPSSPHTRALIRLRSLCSSVLKTVRSVPSFLEPFHQPLERPVLTMRSVGTPGQPRVRHRGVRIGELARGMRVAVEREQATGRHAAPGEVEVDILPRRIAVDLDRDMRARRRREHRVPVGATRRGATRTCGRADVRGCARPACAPPPSSAPSDRGDRSAECGAATTISSRRSSPASCRRCRRRGCWPRCL